MLKETRAFFGLFIKGAKGDNNKSVKKCRKGVDKGKETRYNNKAVTEDKDEGKRSLKEL